ncbi:MAG TPA: Ldh family oxidoreductase, partial [Burkholderiales bacterium]|nr:Ldh family oxidoreductase [Burkholderiales bacterium]
AWHKDTSHAVGNGHVHIAIDISRFMDPGAFKRRIDELVDMLKSAPRRADVDEILMPGERAHRAWEINRREGVPLSDAVASDLCALADRLRVSAPDWLSANRSLAH